MKKEKKSRKEINIIGSDVFLIRTFGISRVLDKVGVEFNHTSLWIGTDYFFIDYDMKKNTISFRRNLYEDVSTDCKKSPPIKFLGKTNYLPEEILTIGQKLLVKFPDSKENSIPFFKTLLDEILCQKKKLNWETLDPDVFIRISKKDKSISTQSCIIL